MAEGKSSGGSWLGNPNVLLALVTIFGGLWLVSHELTSDRPASVAGEAIPSIAEQGMDARLWEDPLKADPKSRADDGKTKDRLQTLVDQIQRRSADRADRNTLGVKLMPVMVPGGQYSEDQENRIRSRYAIVSALGRMDYTPEDSEHLGALRLPWLSRREIEEARRNDCAEALWSEPPDGLVHLLGQQVRPDSPGLRLRYEWYRPRTFAAGKATQDPRPRVLVLWLDESYFEDLPLLRLAMLLEGLGVRSDDKSDNEVSDSEAGKDKAEKGSTFEVALIGPRSSTVLREILPKWSPASPAEPPSIYPNIDARVKNVLRCVDLYSSTASAMDEVLVREVKEGADIREAVGRKLVEEVGFRSFRNFSATDARLAEEVLKELARREADLGDTRNHIALISEWDTFYGRMFSLTYSTELTRQLQDRRRDPAIAGTAPSRAALIKRFIEAGRNPSNFHPFVYLRGLDGRTVGGAPDQKKDDRGRQSAHSLENLSSWTPDINKAQGPAQFDYLGRLGDQIAELQEGLLHTNKGKLKAVGVVGSDVYDTLLIMQALRRRFPEVLFFTSDLDARFWNPREREWTRNMIVVSSYGLALHPSLQGSIAPFRDSGQTAQFAAVLAALGHKELRDLKSVTPRCFEIGNGVVVDLSSADDAVGPRSAGAESKNSKFQLHPLTASETHQARAFQNLGRLAWAAVAVVLFIGAVCWLSESLRRLTWKRRTYPGQSLLYTEADVGGIDGIQAILRGLDALPDNKLAVWLLGNDHLQKLRKELRELIKNETPASAGEALDVDAEPPPEGKESLKQKWAREQKLGEIVSVMVGLLNRLLERKASGDDLELLCIPIQHSRCGVNSKVRDRLDRLLDECVQKAGVFGAKGAAPNLESVTEEAARTARECAGDLYRLHQLRGRWFLGWILGIAVFGGILAAAIWYDTYCHEEGEPFSLISGISSWPAEIVRFGVMGLAIWFGFSLWHSSEETFLTLTRRFRFRIGARESWREPEDALNKRSQEPGARVMAEWAWQEYRNENEWAQRWKCVLLMAGIYALFLIAIWQASATTLLNPTRGPMVAALNSLLIAGSGIGFIVLGFLAVDKAHLCRQFIRRLSEAPTLYTDTTLRHFGRRVGHLDNEYLDEWIDLELIADLTEYVGRLIYYPTILLLMMVLARNSLWDAWRWPPVLVASFVCNFLLAIASVVILQRAAKEAKRVAEKNLAEKVRKQKARIAPSREANDAARGEELLKEVQAINRGAFVPFWENPVVGAIFLSSGGTTMLQLVIWFVSR